MSDDPSNADLMNAILDLHEATTRGFGQVDARFNRIETRVTSIEGELKGIHRWMAHGDARFDALERRKGR